MGIPSYFSHIVKEYRHIIKDMKTIQLQSYSFGTTARQHTLKPWYNSNLTDEIVRYPVRRKLQAIQFLIQVLIVPNVQSRIELISKTLDLYVDCELAFW